MRSNKTLIIAILIIMVISFFNMQNAKLLGTLFNNHLIKQIIWYVIGFLIIFLVNKINIHSIFKYAKYLYIASLILLVVVLLFGKVINGAKAWLSIGPISFQPSELVKLAFSLYLSKYVADYQINGFKSELLLIIKVIILTLIPSILIFLEPDTGAIIFLLIIALSILFTKGIKKYWFFILSAIIFLVILVFAFLYLYNQDLLIKLIGTSFFYRVERIISFKQASSYQLENALIAIGASGIFGTGLNKIAIYIPEAPTDFIFAFNISNFGLISGLIILLCYLIIDLYLILVLEKEQNKKIKLFLSSFINIFIFQQIINIGMNLGLLPIIGIPLPFLSYGGSTIVMYFIFIALILRFNNSMDMDDSNYKNYSSKGLDNNHNYMVD